MKSNMWIAAVFAAGMMQCVHGQTLIDLGRQTRNIDFSKSAGTKPFQTGTALPLNCSPGSVFFKLDAQAGQNLYACTATGTWTLEGATPITSIFGRTGAITPQTGDYSFSQIAGTVSLSQGGTGAATAAAARSNLGAAALLHTHTLTDVDGVSGKQGSSALLQAFGGGTVNANDCARFDAGGNVVSTGAPCVSSMANSGQSFTAATTVTIAHNANTWNPLVECFDNAAAPAQVEYNSLAILDANSVRITFAGPQSGKCVVNTAGGGNGGTVTNAGTLSNGLPVVGNGGADIRTAQLGVAAFLASALSGNGLTLATTTGSLTAGNCAKADAAGNLVDAGAPCGTGAGGTVSASVGIVGDGSAGNPLRINTAAVVEKLSGSISWQPGGGSLAAGTCAVTSMTVPGAALGDAVAPGWPLAVFQTGANHLVWGEMFPSAPDTVMIKVCNAAASAISFQNETYKAMVLQ